MDAINYVLFGVASVAALAAMLYMWREEYRALRSDRAEVPPATPDETGRRRDVGRRDEVEAQLRDYRMLSRRYHYRNRLVGLVALPFVLTTIAGLRWQNDISGDASAAANRATGAALRASDAISQIQDERRRNILRSCLGDHERDVAVDRGNTGLRTFVLATLPADVRHDPIVSRYLRGHPREFPARTPSLGATRPGPPTPPELIVAYLRRAAQTWPVVEAARRSPAQVKHACDVQVGRTVQPVPVIRQP